MGARECQAEGEETGVGKPGQMDVHMGIALGKAEFEDTPEGMEKE